MKAKNNIAAALLCVFSVSMTFALIPFVTESETIRIQEQMPTIIESLQNGESYSIEITSVGCFGGSRQTVTIFNEEGVFTAHFKDNSKVLSENEINAFVDFELQLRSLKGGGCTTIDTYVLRYGGEKFQTSDGTCAWNGGKKLLQQLGYVQ